MNRLRNGFDPAAFDRNGNLKWAVVAAIISAKGDGEYTAAQIRNIAQRAMRKLKAELARLDKEEADMAMTYFADLAAGEAAYRAWRHRVEPKLDHDYETWGD